LVDYQWVTANCFIISGLLTVGYQWVISGWISVGCQAHNLAVI